MRRPQVLVVGAGVSGLTTALCLKDAGIRVQVRARERDVSTTSCAAGAIWGPYLVTDERVLEWSEQSRLELSTLADDRDSGVCLVTGLEASAHGAQPPDWARQLPGFRPAEPGEVPHGFRSAWWYTAPVVTMPRYLTHLADRLRDGGVPIETGTVNSLVEAVEECPIVVNCTGIDAARLVPDGRLSATRGQLVVVENPGVTGFFVEHEENEDATYYLPHGDHLVLGGSSEPGRLDLRPDPVLTRAIRARCAAIEPLLAGARERGARVGLRPMRTRVRLERVPVGRGYVVHNYGHGGSGVTLSWGCAHAVRSLVTAVL